MLQPRARGFLYSKVISQVASELFKSILAAILTIVNVTKQKQPRAVKKGKAKQSRIKSAV